MTRHVKIDPNLIGACGRACLVCSYFEDGICKNCKVENFKMEKNCLIYSCVSKKKIACCLQCQEKRPCKLWQGLSIGYCLVYSSIKA